MATIDQKQKLTQQQLAILASEMDKNKKSIGVTYFLLIILGWTGAHQFYLGKKGKGLLYLALFLLPFIVFILSAPLLNSLSPGPEEFFGNIMLSWIVVGILWIIDLFTIPSQTRKVNEAIEDRIIRNLAKKPPSNGNGDVNKPVGKAKDLSSLYGLRDD